MRILHLSDPHVQLPRWRERPLRDFGPLRALATVELWKGRGRDYDGALERLRQIVRDADALRADLVVCTGDLTQLAMEEEFALAQDALAPLGDRLICIPGNHDRYPLAGHPNRLYESYFPSRPLPERFAALDSCGTAAQNTLGGIPLVTDSLGHYSQLILAEAPAREACVRIIANDYLQPDDSVVSAVVHVPLAPRSDTVRVDLILP